MVPNILCRPDQTRENTALKIHSLTMLKKWIKVRTISLHICQHCLWIWTGGPWSDMYVLFTCWGWGVRSCVCVCVSVWEVWRGRCKGRYLPPPSAPGRHSVVWCPLSACSHAKETHSPSLENILLSHARNCLPGRPPGLKEDNPGTVEKQCGTSLLIILDWTVDLYHYQGQQSQGS